MDLNKVMLIGNMTQDPEVRTTPNGISVTSFGLATNLVWTDQSGQKQERAEFHNIVAWRKLAEIIGQYLHKGSKIYIEGRLQTREWEGQDGVKRYKTEIVAENMIMLGGRGDGGNAGNSNFAPAKPAPAAPSEPTVNPLPESNEEEIEVENIPF